MNRPVHGVFHSQNVGLLNAKLSRVLDDYDPFFIRNCLRQDIEQSGLSGSRSATNKDGLPVLIWSLRNSASAALKAPRAMRQIRQVNLW